MSNKRRICKPNLTYHTYSRCCNNMNLMKHKQLKELMIKVLKMALKKYNFKLNNLAILNNHFHFYIKTVKNGPNISTIMQFVKSQYATRYNKKMNRIGPFWNERFGDTIIEYMENPEFGFLWVNLYIAYNPVRKEYVNNPRDYEYCCINSYFDKDYIPPLKITLHEFFLDLGKTFEERASKFREFEDMFKKISFPGLKSA